MENRHKVTVLVSNSVKHVLTEHNHRRVYHMWRVPLLQQHDPSGDMQWQGLLCYGASWNIMALMLTKMTSDHDKGSESSTGGS